MGTNVSKNNKCTYLELVEKNVDGKIFIWFDKPLSSGNATTMFLCSYDPSVIEKSVAFIKELIIKKSSMEYLTYETSLGDQFSSEKSKDDDISGLNYESELEEDPI